MSRDSHLTDRKQRTCTFCNKFLPSHAESLPVRAKRTYAQMGAFDHTPLTPIAPREFLEETFVCFPTQYLPGLFSLID